MIQSKLVLFTDFWIAIFDLYLFLDLSTDVATQYKLCRVKHSRLGDKGIPFVTLHDGRTVRFPDPEVKVNDTVMLDIETNKIIDFINRP